MTAHVSADGRETVALSDLTRLEQRTLCRSTAVAAPSWRSISGEVPIRAGDGKPKLRKRVPPAESRLQLLSGGYETRMHGRASQEEGTELSRPQIRPHVRLGISGEALAKRSLRT